MKILQVVNKMNIGGIETLLMNIYRNIDRQKYNVVFLTYNDFHYDYEDEILSLGGRILRIPNPNSVSLPRFILNLYKVIKQENPDVIHCHTAFNSAYVVLVAKLAGVKNRLIHSHTTLPLLNKNLIKKFKWFVARMLMKTCSTKNLACSIDAGKALFKNLEFELFPNGIDFNRFYFNEQKRIDYRKWLNIKNDDFVVGHVGRLDIPKNHKFLLKIFKEILNDKPNSKLILVGTGPLENKIEKQAEQLGIKDQVIFLGNRSDVNYLLNCFDIFVFPSIFEGLPVSLVEAQANGLPILVSDVVSEEIKLTSVLHFYSLQNFEKKWAEKIIEMNYDRIDTKNDLLKSDYSIQNTIKKLMDIYDK